MYRANLRLQRFRVAILTTRIWQKTCQLARFWKFECANLGSLLPSFFLWIFPKPFVGMFMEKKMNLPFRSASFQRDLKVQISKNLPIWQVFTVSLKTALTRFWASRPAHQRGPYILGCRVSSNSLHIILVLRSTLNNETGGHTGLQLLGVFCEGRALWLELYDEVYD